MALRTSVRNLIIKTVHQLEQIGRQFAAKQINMPGTKEGNAGKEWNDSWNGGRGERGAMRAR